jgi:hypothetical protein
MQLFADPERVDKGMETEKSSTMRLLSQIPLSISPIRKAKLETHWDAK